MKESDCSALANFGTGSQISMVGRLPGGADGDIEQRPYLNGSFLVSGSALCGGRAYALLERFFAAYAGRLGVDEPQYTLLNRLAAEGVDRPLDVRATFCGRRSDPLLRGEIRGIGEDNFTPEGLAAGVLYGMAEELHAMFAAMTPQRPVTTLAASGNAVRLNPALRQVLARVFGMAVKIPVHTEEAAHGAAMYASLAAGLVRQDELGDFITYLEE